MVAKAGSILITALVLVGGVAAIVFFALGSGTSAATRVDVYDPLSAQYDCNHPDNAAVDVSRESWLKSRWWANRFACRHTYRQSAFLIFEDAPSLSEDESPRHAERRVCRLEVKHGTYASKDFDQCVVDYRHATS